MKNKKIGAISLGCPKNLVDTEVMLGLAQNAGWNTVTDENSADVLLINTCAFIRPAEEEAYQEIEHACDLKRKGKVKAVIVAGCLPKRRGKELEKKYPLVDVFLDTSNFDAIQKVLNDIITNKMPYIPPKPNTFLYNHSTPRLPATGGPFAYIKISEGCDLNCSFCIVPKLRGPMQSRPVASIVKEAEHLKKIGMLEINLIAQDLTAYGIDINTSLEKLLKVLDKADTPPWIRLLYCHPDRVGDKLIKIMADSEKILPYIDIPIQHISEKILKAMKRPHNPARIKNLINKLRKQIPNITIRTTLLVGFPGESEKDFEMLCNFVREYELDHIGVFPYYKEDGTPAASMTDQIPEEEKLQRAETIIKIQKDIVAKRHKNSKDKIINVLITGKSDRTDYPWIGRSISQAPDIDGCTFIKGEGLSPHMTVKARQEGYEEYDILATVV